MSRSKKWAVQALLTFITFFVFLDMFTMRQDFPFAPFDMFAGIYHPGFSGVQAYETLSVKFVRKNGVEEDANDFILAPLDHLRLQESLQRTISDQEITKKKLTNVLDRARSNHLSWPQKVPEFNIIKLYRSATQADHVVITDRFQKSDLIARVEVKK